MPTGHSDVYYLENSVKLSVRRITMRFIEFLKWQSKCSFGKNSQKFPEKIFKFWVPIVTFVSVHFEKLLLKYIINREKIAIVAP